MYSSGDVSGPNVAYLTYEGESPIPPSPGQSSDYGLEIAPYWACCEGSCNFPITMPQQLGWWIGGAVERTLVYRFGSSSTYYIADFSSSTTATINVPSSTPYGFVNMQYLLSIGDTLVAATGSVMIQIVAGGDCISYDPETYAAYCAQPCAGLATSTNPLDLDNFACGLREFGCWLTIIDQSALMRLSSQWTNALHKFPLAPITRMQEDLTLMATGTQAIAAGTVSVPLWSTSTHTYVGHTATLYTATTTAALVKFRRFARILIWSIAAAAIVATTVIVII